MGKKLTYKYAEEFFKDNGCILLSKDYKNNRTKLDYICNCGTKSKITFSNFKNGQRCKKCSSKVLSKKFSHSYSYIKSFFENNECILLEKEYTNSSIHLNYICSCGKKSKTTFDTFKNGHRCRECGAKKRSGKNAYQWNSNLTDEDRKDRRLIPGYKQWIKNIYRKDSWVCQCCGNNRKLNAHHIKNYADHKKCRLDINNGITFCKQCHIDFHAVYGNKNNNSTQLSQFLERDFNG